MCASLRPFPLLALALLAWSSAPADDAPARAPRRPFLGVHVCAVPPEVRAQTDLEEGAGLLIDFIQPKSPAYTAGIQQFDVLLKIGDQRVLNEEQFVSLIRASAPGQELDLTLLRRGKEQAVKVTLGDAPAIPDKPMPAAVNPKSSVDAWLLEMLKSRPDAHKLIEEAMKNWAAEKDAANGNSEASASQKRSICRKDTAGEVEIIERNHETVAKVKDPAGKIIFEGPISTKAERDAIDPAIRTRIEAAEKCARSLRSP